MPTIYAMRRANGEFFKIASNGFVAVWAGEESLQRSRAHNRELDIYRPIAIDRRVAEKIRAANNEKPLWLVEPITTNSNLTEGRRTDWTELSNLQTQEPPEPQTLQRKVRAHVQEYHFM